MRAGKAPIKESSELLIIKFLGYGFLLSIATSIGIVFLKPESLHLYFFTHLSVALGSLLAGIIKGRYSSTKRK